MLSSHTPSEPILYSFPTTDDVVTSLAAFILKAQFEAIDKRGKFTIALSGGSLPKMLKGLVGAEGVEWEKWHVFFADERIVRLDHPDSNYLLCHNELFSKIPQIPRDNIHCIDIDTFINDLVKTKKEGVLPGADRTMDVDELLASSLTDPKDPAKEDEDDEDDEDDDDEPGPVKKLLQNIAEEYESQLKKEFASRDSARFPVFDLIMLGMGPDGHTASLFPGDKLLTKEYDWVAHINNSPKPPPNRVTFTLPVINHAAKVAFVATGAGKQDILSQVMDRPELGLPSSRVRPKSPGAVFWFVDDAAAAKVVYKKTPFKL